MVNTSCAVYRCGSTSHKHKGVKFHQFPRDERCQLWIQACKRNDLTGKYGDQLKHMHVCSLHFERRMYGKQLLKKSAVPTLNLPITVTTSSFTQTENSEPTDLQVYTSQGVQTDDEVFYVVSQTVTPEIPSGPYVHSKIKGDQNQNMTNMTIEQFLLGCDAFLPENLSTLIKSHINSSMDCEQNVSA